MAASKKDQEEKAEQKNVAEKRKKTAAKRTPRQGPEGTPATEECVAQSAATADGGGESEARMTQDDMIRDYRKVYDRCMEGETKAFDAKGALSALGEIGKLLGLDASAKDADAEDDKVTLKLSDAVGERGD